MYIHIHIHILGALSAEKQQRGGAKHSSPGDLATLKVLVLFSCWGQKGMT